MATETYFGWATTLLIVGGVIALLLGSSALSRARHRQTVFRIRRQATIAGWRNLTLGVLLLCGGAAVWLIGQPVVELLIPPTATPTVSPTPSPTSPSTPTPSLTSPPSATLPPSATVPASVTPVPSATITPTLTATPVLPFSQIVLPPGTLTVTPPPNGVIANLRMSIFNECGSQRGVGDTFAANVKTVYALFDYDGWLPGAQWSNVWRFNGRIAYTETLLWDGSTGGCGFADYDNAGQPWEPGAYEVQIFLGERWVGSSRFFVGVTPTPSP